MRVSNVMTTPVCFVDPDATLGEAATLMGERHVGSALVMSNPSGSLLGIVTERDILRALSNDYDAPLRSVTEYMTKDPVTVIPGVDLREALRVMIDGGFRHLPVLDGDAVIGVVSMRDVAGALSE